MGRGEDVLVGGLCLVLAFIMAKRMWDALQAGEMPLYRTRLRRDEVSAAKYKAMVALNAVLVVVILTVGADLLLGLNLRGR